MKQILITIFIVFISSTLFAQLQIDSLGLKNFSRAGKALVAESDTILIKLRESVKEQFLTMTEDGKITKSDMLELEKKVNLFENTKKTFNKKLNMYGLSTNIFLDDSYRNIIDTYFRYGRSYEEYDGQDLYYTDNKAETMRKIVVSIVGHDVTISSGFIKKGGYVILSIFTSLLLSVLLFIFFVYVINLEDDTCLIISFGIWAVILAVLLFLVT